MELESNYEITRVANYILTHNFSRVAFQVKKKKKLLFFHFHKPISYAEVSFTTQNPLQALVNRLIYSDISWFIIIIILFFLGG